MAKTGKVKIFANLSRPGQVLSSPVFDEHGLLLAGEGTEITEKQIQLFKAAGISAIEVPAEGSFKWQKYMSGPERINTIREKLEKSSNIYMLTVEKALIDKLSEKSVQEG